MNGIYMNMRLTLLCCIRSQVVLQLATKKKNIPFEELRIDFLIVRKGIMETFTTIQSKSVCRI